MRSFARKVTIFFAAGCLGGLASSVALWLFGRYGITSAFDVRISPHMSPAWLYPRIVWGGIWAALFFLPLLKGRILSRGFLMSIGPTIVQLFLIFPYESGAGMMGLKLGTLTPVFVVIFNAVWGITAVLWLRYAR